MKITKRQLEKLVESIVKEHYDKDNLDYNKHTGSREHNDGIVEPRGFRKLVGVLKKIWAPVWDSGDSDAGFDDDAYMIAESQTEKVIKRAGMKSLEIKAQSDDYTNSLEAVIVRVLYKSPTGESKRGAILIDETSVTWSDDRLFTHKGWEG